MYQVSSIEHRKIVAAVARSNARPPKSMRDFDWRLFLQTYSANVEDTDLAQRDPS